MRLIGGYLIREISVGIVMVLLGFLGLFAFFDLIRELDDVGKLDYKLQHALAFVALGLPSHVYEVMPVAALIGCISGMLVAPITTIYYDSGFLIGLKGFVAAIVGGLASYPAAALGAIFVGLIESFGSFWASAFKEVIVFTLIIPVLLWRSFQHGHHDEEE